MYYYIRTAVVIALLQIALYAQSPVPPPIEWGEIPREDLEMKSFPKDSNATALILCDYGDSFLNDELGITYTRHLRVKILNKDGYKWGTHSVILNTGRGGERLTDIEGVTYNLSATGEVVTSELNDDDIFEEEVSDTRTRYKFSLPNLQPGSVIEIRYKIYDSEMDVNDWTFQYDEPVRWSEYRLRTPRNISFAIVTLGFQPWEIRENSLVMQSFRGDAEEIFGNGLIECVQYRWAVKNVPALRDEPFVTTLDDYKNKLMIQLSGYAFPHTGVKQVLNTWPKLIEELVKDEDFYDQIDVTGDVEEQAAKITAGITNPKDKMIAVYNWVKDSVTFEHNYTIFARKDVDELLEERRGGSSEITFLLLSLLKSAGISGEPVILSTRDNGAIQELYPIYSQFNYVLAKVDVGNESFLLAPTNHFRPYDILPISVLNVTGLLISENNAGWIDITTSKKHQNNSVTNITVKEDGSVEGNFDDSFMEYAAVSLRDDLKNKKNLDAGKEIFDVEGSGIKIDSVNFQGKDSISAPLRVTAWFSSDEYAQKNADMIYINPYIIHRETVNPFKSPKRMFPMDFAYKISSTRVINLFLPAGYRLKGVINNRANSVSTYASYSRAVQSDQSRIQIITKYDIKESVIKSDYYEQLKNFFSQIIDSQAEMIVLEKIPDGQVPAGSNTSSMDKDK